MSNTYNNQNLFQDTVVFGNFINCDDIKTGGNTANAKFKRDVIVGGNLNLGRELSTTTDGVTTYTDTGGDITFKINGITYTITPTILKHISSITSDFATTIDKKAPKDSPEFTGTPLTPTPTSIYDNSNKIVTAEWVHNLISSLTTGTKISQYIIAYANKHMDFKFTPTYNILGKNYYTNNLFTDGVSFGEYFVSSSGATGIISGYGWNDGIWKASTEGRYYVEVKLNIEYDFHFVGGGSNQNLDNQFVLYVKDVNNTTITSKTIYSRTTTQYTDSINYKTLIFIPLNGYFTILKEGNKNVNLTWGYDTYTNGDVFASIKVTQIY